MRSSRLLVLRAAPAVLLTACYQYTATPVADAPTAREVRVALTEDAAARLAATLGPRAAVLEGRVVARSDTAIDLAVETIRRTNGSEESWGNARVVLPRAALASVQVQRFAAVRTAAVVVGAVVGSILIGRSFQDGEDIGRGGGRPPSGGQ